MTKVTKVTVPLGPRAPASDELPTTSPGAKTRPWRPRNRPGEAQVTKVTKVTAPLGP